MSNRVVSSNQFSTNTLCWYKFTPSYSTGGIDIRINSLSSAIAEVYEETSTNTFIYQDSVTSGNTLFLATGSENSVWVLANPSSSYAFINMTAQAYSSNEEFPGYNPHWWMPVVAYSVLIVLIIITIVIYRKTPKSNENRNIQRYDSASRNRDNNPPASLHNNNQNQIQHSRDTQQSDFQIIEPVIHSQNPAIDRQRARNDRTQYLNDANPLRSFHLTDTSSRDRLHIRFNSL